MAKLIKGNFQLLMAKLNHTEKENKTCRSTKALAKVPKGFFPILVGEERKRYVVPITFLSSRLFQALLNQYEEQIRATSKGPIIVPCSTEMFEHILHFLQPQTTISACQDFSLA